MGNLTKTDSGDDNQKGNGYHPGAQMTIFEKNLKSLAEIHAPLAHPFGRKKEDRGRTSTYFPRGCRAASPVNHARSAGSLSTAGGIRNGRPSASLPSSGQTAGAACFILSSASGWDTRRKRAAGCFLIVKPHRKRYFRTPGCLRRRSCGQTGSHPPC